jgi:hypothetical protein
MILGSIAFEAYDYGIHYLERVTKIKHLGNTHAVEKSSSSGDSMYTQTTIPQHFLVGAFSGGIYSLSLFSWESIASKMIKVVHSPLPAPPPSPSPLFYTLMSNTLSHSILYGSYEGFKRCLYHSSQQHHYRYPSMRSIHDDNDDDAPMMIPWNVSIFGIAGGTAGVIHHSMSHFMERWREGILQMEDSVKMSWMEKVKVYTPTVKSTLFAFLSHAIGFVAFECGKGIMTEVL